MGIRVMLRDTSLGTIAGLGGVKLMDPVTTRFYEMQSEEDKQREKAVSSGVAYDVAARKIGDAVGLHLSESEVTTAAMGFHYGLGVSGGVLYVLLRKVGRLSPLTSGLTMALGLWATVDEGANAVFGFSAPPADYPLSTHLRGLVGHLALGLGTAISAELLFWMTCTGPSRR